MRFIQEHTTKRYIGNKNCNFEEFLPDIDGFYQYGCEFEFYIDTDNMRTKRVLKKLLKCFMY